MKGFCERIVASKCSPKSTTDTPNSSFTSDCSEPGSNYTKFTKTSLWSSIFASAFSVFETYRESSACEKKGVNTRNNGWTSAVKRIVAGSSMRRIHERVLGPSKTGIPSAVSDIWLLGICYKISPDESSATADASNGLAAFTYDLSSRILMTYRRGFEATEDSKFTSDAGWGCMLRSSQMLIAQALLFHQLGRTWRKPKQKPLDHEYVEILQLFGDSKASAFSIHNLVQAGKAYGLAAGSWVGPYAMCRSWEYLARSLREDISSECQSLPMAVYVVSGDEDGERGGAPVVCIEDAARHCLEFSNGEAEWTPILLLVPLVLGLEKVNPRYIPSLQETFTFPQSLGILGGKPGASTYIVGVQDDNAFYLDPHEVQPAIGCIMHSRVVAHSVIVREILTVSESVLNIPCAVLVVNISRDDAEVDASSYHCSVIRHIPLDSVDPSLAIGFYCRDKDDFDDFCVLAIKLSDKSNGAPLFTVAHSRKLVKHGSHCDMLSDINNDVGEDDSLSEVGRSDPGGCAQEDDWQLL